MKRKAAFVIALFSLIALALSAQKQNASHPSPERRERACIPQDV